MDYIAAIDQGTTSTRCLIFNRKGKVVASSQKEHLQIYPYSGWVEHNPVEILENCISVFRSTINSARIGLNQIKALGIANQRETTLLWNKATGKPYGNAIVWQDTRTDNICVELQSQGFENLIRKKTGLPIATYFSAPKIKWIIENNPEVKRDIQNKQVLFGNIDSWLLWNLTGGVKSGIHSTDVTNASRTLLMNLNSLRWDDDLLKILAIPREILPAIHPSSNLFGETSIDGYSIPITGIMGDQQAALFGQTCFLPGEAKNTYGTGCFMLLNTGSQIIQSQHGLISTVAYQLARKKPVYCLEGSIAIAGALVQWLRDNIAMIDNSQEIERIAATVADNGGVYFVPAFSGLYAPYWNSEARGLIIGLTQYANKGHLARAALEATAFQTCEVLDAMKKDANMSVSELKVDGGMVKNRLLMQFQADLLEIPVIRPTLEELTALGAAYAAGLAINYWQSLDELKSFWQEEMRWLPKMQKYHRNDLYTDWKRAVKRSFGWKKPTRVLKI